MEALVLKILGHLDLNKDGKPDLEQIHALADKWAPKVKQLAPLWTAFVAAGGLAELKTLLASHLSPSNLALVEEAIAVLSKV